MKLNEFTVITGNFVILTPYEKIHVPKYHEWMENEELRLLTASELLSIEEEYKMQIDWRTDPDKCTFIVLNKKNYDETCDEVKEMIGDTNIFLRRENEIVTGEIEIMIAEKEARGKGFGKEAVLLMLRYGVEDLKINVYEAKIGKTNEHSITLFKSLGFVKISENSIFNEFTFSINVSEQWLYWLKSQTQYYKKTVKNSGVKS